MSNGLLGVILSFVASSNYAYSLLLQILEAKQKKSLYLATPGPSLSV